MPNETAGPLALLAALIAGSLVAASPVTQWFGSRAIVAGEDRLHMSDPAGRDTGLLPFDSPGGTQALEADLDSFVREAMAKIGAVPGLALSVVRADTVLVEGAWGLRDVANGLPVTPETGFYIASSTKSYVALLTVLLARGGVLDLDAPLTACLPGLDLNGTVAAADITLRDLLRHTRGWEANAAVTRTAYTDFMEPAELRAHLSAYATVEDDGYFAYDNIGYVVTDLCFREKLGTSWKELLEVHVLARLGLRHTTPYVSESAGTGDFALPHLWDGERHRAIPPKTDAIMHAAGGLMTTVRDAGTWLRAHLGGGSLDGERVFPADAIAEVLRRQVEADLSFWRFQRLGYGLGWFDGAYRGDRLVHHFGGYPGAQAHLSLMPERGVGVAVLVNGGGRGGYLLPHIVAAYVYDLLAGRADARDRAEAALEEAAAAALSSASARASRWAELERLKGAPPAPAHAPNWYAGRYRNGLFGTVSIVPAVHERFWVDWGAREGDLVPLGGDVFLADWEPGLRPDTLEFHAVRGDRARSFTWRGVRFLRETR